MVTGSDDFTKAATISGLLSVIFIGFSSMINKARDFDIGAVLVGWIIFTIMFVPRSTVLIEDTIDGSVRVVDNVPLGVAASGGIISQLGHGLSNIFEQAYSHTTSHLGNGYFTESLVVLNSVRTKAFNSKVLNAMDEATGWNMYDSYYNYMKECTAKGQVTGNTRNQALAKNFFDLIKQDSSLFHTLIFPNRNDPNGETVTCTQAYGMLSTKLNDAIGSGTVHKILGETTGFKDRLLMGTTNEMGEPHSFMSNIQNSLDMLTMGGNVAQEYVKLAILEPIYMNAIQGYYMNMQDMTSALMLNQAINQRNIQWAAEQSMFMTSVRPLMAFFEAFIYAILPILGVMLIAGRFGFGLAGKYLMVLIWVQLWFPLLSIVNLFITIATTREMRQFSDGINSIYALDKSTDILQNWIGVGGMLAGYTPVLALFVVGGSIFTLNSIASKVSGADNVNEKMTNPDITNAPSLMEQQAGNNYSKGSGRTHSGVDSSIGTINLGSAVQQGETLAKNKSENASLAFSQGLGRTIGNMSSFAEQASALSTIGSNFMAGNTEQSQMVQQQALAIQKEHNLSDSQTRAVAGAVALTFGGGADHNILSNLVDGFKDKNSNTNSSGKTQETPSRSKGQTNTIGMGADVKAGIEAKNSNTTTSASSKSVSEALGLSDQISGNKTQSAAFSKQMADNFVDGYGHTSNNTLSDGNTEQLNKLASASVAASKTHSEISGIANSISSSVAPKATAFSQQIQQSPEAMRAMESLFDNSSPETRTAIANRARQLKNYGGVSPKDAHYAAMGEVLTNANTFKNDTGAYINAVNGVAGAYQMASGIPTGSFNNPSNEGNNIPSPGVNYSGLSANVNKGINSGSVVPEKGYVPDLVYQNLTNSGTDRPLDLNRNPNAAVTSANKQNKDNLANNYSQKVNEATNKKLGEIYKGYTATPVSVTEADKFWGWNANAIDSVKDKWNSVTGQISAGLNQVGTVFDKGWTAAENGYKTEVEQSNVYKERDSQRVAQATKWGLTDNQAKYMASMYPGSQYDTGQLKSAVINEYGSSPIDQEVGQKTAEWIEAAYGAGKSGGAYLAPVAKINDVKKFKDQSSDFLSNAPSSSNGSSLMMNPVDGARDSSPFGMRTHPITGQSQHHNGQDFAAPKGTPIKAVLDGVVTFNGAQNGYGNIMILDHGNGMETRYAHNSWNNPDLKVGSKVDQGEVIGKVGSTGASTGNHLHFEVRENGEPIDPMKYLSKN